MNNLPTESSETSYQTYPATNPLVSICIPTYNGERFIAETIKSALEQTYRPLEILISDDYSSDRTLEIAHSLLDRIVDEVEVNPGIQVKILCHDRYGLAKNWNHCILASEGKYLKFLFQDDLLLPNCISEMVELAQKDDQIGFVFCQREVICEDGLEFDPLYGTNLTDHWGRLQTIQSGLDLLLDPNLLQEPLNKIGEPTNVLLSRWAIAQAGEFDPNLVQVLDWDMWLRLFAVGKVGYLEQVLVKFRVHSQQVSQGNAESGASWLDNWKLQLKMLSDRDYEFLPESLRQQILSLSTEHLRSFHQNQQDLNKQIQTLYSDRQSSADQLVASQKQYQSTIEQLSIQKQELQQTLRNNYREHQTNIDQLTLKIDQLVLNLQQAHQNLTQLGKDSERIHQAFLAKNAEQIETKIQLDSSNALIREMEDSKFWKLRNFWFDLKQKLV
jgi:glycosyltransferase involved in cell wall biosynthesis